MRTYQQTLEQSYTYLKAKRPSISFNEKDAGRTMEVEGQILGARASRFQLPIGKVQSSTTALGGAVGTPSFASFVQQQQQQQQQHSAMAIDPSLNGVGFGSGGFPAPGQQGGGGGFTFGAPPQ